MAIAGQLTAWGSTMQLCMHYTVLQLAGQLAVTLASRSRLTTRY